MTDDQAAPTPETAKKAAPRMAYKYRLYPSPVAEQLLCRSAAAVRASELREDSCQVSWRS